MRLLCYLFLLCCSLAAAQRVVTAGEIDVALHDWDFSSADRCRLLAHQSVILENKDHHILVIDGGFGSFHTKSEVFSDADTFSDGWTIAFDLSKGFDTPGLEPLWMYKKPNGTKGPPVTNHGGMWYSTDENVIWIQGGHYYNNSNWTSSSYHVSKWQIPSYQIWQMNVTHPTDGWKDVTNDVQGHEMANRTFAGAAVSVPNANKSFWIGGLIDPTTSSTTSNDTLSTSNQFLVMDHATNTLSKQVYYDPQSTDGDYQGDLVHLPIGPKNGYLMSLMSLQRSINSPLVDVDGADGNQEVGDPVQLDTIPMYDLETGTWFDQKTSWFNGEIPEPRTRFCSAVFYDNIDKTWNLFVHGGQLLSDQNAGVSDIYVLSMPSFIWSKVQTTLPDTNLIRSHTCHAVGGQFVIVGGYPPGLQVPTNATCDAEYIKVLSIDKNGMSWTGKYSTDTAFRTPQTIRNIVNSRVSPYAGFANSKLEFDFRYTGKGESNVRGIAGGVIGAVAGAIVIGVGFWYGKKRQARKAAAAAALQGDRPAPVQFGNPDEDKNASSTVIEMIIHDRRGGREGQPITTQAHAI